MEKNILSEFLDANLLATLRNDDDLKLLQMAADELGASLLEKPSAIPHFVVAALDSGVPGSDPAYKVVQAIAKSKWNTILNVIGAEPIQVYRGIILGGLEIVVSGKPQLTSAILLAAANVPKATFGTKEAEPISNFLARLESEEAAQVENVWVSPQSIDFAIAGSKPRNLNVKADILNGLSKATGPTNLKGETVDGFNPTYATASQEWTKFFVETAGETLFKAIQAGFDQNSLDIKNAVSSLKVEFDKMVTRDTKCELLWLKESGYSPSRKKCLREMGDIEILFFSVLDVSNLVGYTSAPSIEWFLYDIVERRCPGQIEVKIAIEGITPFLKDILDELSPLQLSEPIGRRTLFEIAVAPSVATSFEEQSGLTTGAKETFPNLARRLFRELQSLKIADRE